MIGIDLGTSNSLVGVFSENEAELIKNEFGNVLTPSVVGVDDNGEVLIGEIAKQRLITHPTKTMAAFKRFMGTEKKYEVNDLSFTPVELSYLILKKLREQAQRHTDEKCIEAVISVPAYFNAIQREATIEAAKLVGFEKVNLISEPTAAAIAYGIHRKQEDAYILVVDLGGGTFDVSLLELFEGVMQVEAIAGDNQLGGEDFTRIIVKDFMEMHGIKEKIISAGDYAAIWNKCENAKCHLSKENIIKIKCVVGEAQLEYEISLEKYKGLCEPLLKRMRKPIAKVLNDSEISLKEIDQIILIGGATRDEVVRGYINRLVGRFPYTKINPDEAVGVGAVIQGELKESKEMLEELILTDVCGYTLGVDMAEKTSTGYRDGVFSPIIERNTTIPVSKISNYYITHKKQQWMHFAIYQGENRLVQDNIKLGEIKIDLPKGIKESDPVEVRFTYNEDSILEVILTVPITKASKRLIIEKAPGRLTAEQIEQRLKKLEKLKIHPLDRAETRLLIARAEKMYVESLGERREYIQHIIRNYEDELKKQEEIVVRKATAEFIKQLNELDKGAFS